MDERKFSFGHKRGPKSKVEILGLQETVKDLYAHGHGSRAISTRLQKKGYDVSFISVQNFINADKKMKRELIAERKGFQAELVKRQFNTHEKLLNLAELVERKIKEYENDPKQVPALLGFIRELHTQLSHMNRLLGDLTPAPQVNISQTNILNTSEISQAFKQELYRWFQEGQAILQEGELIFKKPSPELLNDYKKWKEKPTVVDAQWSEEKK